MDFVSDLVANEEVGQWLGGTWWWSSFALSQCLPTPLTLALALVVIVVYVLNQAQNGAAFNSKRNRGKFLIWWYRWTAAKSILNNNNNNNSIINNNSRIKSGTSTTNDKVDKFSSIYLLPDAPSPLSLPIIGHIYMLAKYPTNPWQGFNAIRDAHGDVVHLKLGVYRAVMVSSIEGMREVLLTKGDMFSNRPHFDRHALIFGRNRQNALALCDWSDNHKARRSIAHAAVIPRFGTNCFQRLTGCIQSSVDKLLRDVANRSNFDNLQPTQIVLEKSCLIKLCCAIFVEFLLEKKMDINDPKFAEICHRYDFIFHDINQMYLSDFLPFLKPIGAQSYLNKVEANANELVNFIQQQIMPTYDKLAASMKLIDNESDSLDPMNKTKTNDRSTSPSVDYDEKSCQERFVDRILLHKQYNSRARFLHFVLKHYLENQKTMSWDECLFEIGDLVGGNSAVANLLVRLLGFLVINPDVQEQLYAEAYGVAKNNSRLPGLNGAEQSENTKIKITLEDRPYMPLTNAAIMETLRLASSPIVPHLARADTSIQGYFIPKDTMILFNVYHLNLSPNYWDQPNRFNPSRFVTEDGNVVKPNYFFPFSHGRRSCLGYKMVNTIIFSTVANLLLHYRLEAGDPANARLTSELLEPRGSIALPYNDNECFNIKLIPRHSQP